MLALLTRVILTTTSVIAAPTDASTEIQTEKHGNESVSVASGLVSGAPSDAANQTPQVIDTHDLADESDSGAFQRRATHAERESAPRDTRAAPPTVVVQEDIGLRREYLYGADGILVGEEVLDTFNMGSLLRGVYFKFDADRLSGVVIEDAGVRELGITYGDDVTLRACDEITVSSHLFRLGRMV